MKKIVFLFFLLSLAFSAICQKAINDSVSAGIMKKMHDSLDLTPGEKNQISDVNRFLASQKQTAFDEISDRDSLRVQLQRVENTRDSLYKKVLSAKKYLMYKEKKRNIVNDR